MVVGNDGAAVNQGEPAPGTERLSDAGTHDRSAPAQCGGRGWSEGGGAPARRRVVVKKGII